MMYVVYCFYCAWFVLPATFGSGVYHALFFNSMCSSWFLPIFLSFNAFLNAIVVPVASSTGFKYNPAIELPLGPAEG